jgi:myosin heavy subunit
MAGNYAVGTRVWQPDPTEGWVASEIRQRKVNGDKVELVLDLENGEVRMPCVTHFAWRRSDDCYKIDQDDRNHSVRLGL